jgi:hypothetical protein
MGNGRGGFVNRRGGRGGRGGFQGQPGQPGPMQQQQFPNYMDMDVRSNPPPSMLTFLRCSLFIARFYVFVMLSLLTFLDFVCVLIV